MKHQRPELRLALASTCNQRGASLIEGIAYLGIAALVILGAASLFTGAFASAESNRGMEEVNAIRTSAKKLYMGQTGGYTGDMVSVLYAAGVMPTTLSASAGTGGGGTTLTNAWGGTVTMTATGGTFTITYTEVPQDSCINMITGATGWLSVAGLTGNPITAVQANGFCVAGNNTLAFVSN